MADDKLTGFGVRVAFTVADHLNRETRLSWPSQERVGAIHGASRRGVQGALDQLAERRHLLVLPSSNRKGGNRYRLLVDGEPIVIPPHLRDEGQNDAQGEVPHANGGAHEIPGHANHGAHETTPHANRNAHEKNSHAHGDASFMRTAVRPNLLSEPTEVESDSPPTPAKPKRAPPKPKAKTSDEDFDAWWAQAPKKTGKGTARRAYDKVILSGAATHAELVAAMMRYAATRVGEDDRYTKTPAPWLNDERWRDVPAPARTGPAVRDQPLTRAQASRAEARAALRAIREGANPDDLLRNVESDGRYRNPQSSRIQMANMFGEELRRRSGQTYSDILNDGGPIIDNEDPEMFT